SGSDAASLRTTARVTEGGWRIDGQKQFITNARHAPFAIVLARVGELDPKRTAAGITAFVVPLDAPGVSVGRPERKLGLRASDTSAIVMDDATIGVDAVPGEAAMAKLYASEMAQRATHAAVQILGGNGYMRDYAVERYARDGRATTIYEGTSEIQRIVIARSLLAA